jgi:large subunit ribosomal protein L33
MAKSKRDDVTLECTVCGEQNYITTRNKRSHPNKMEKMKYCSRCKKETLHKEAK